MKLDHVSFAAQPDGLEATTERIADRLGIEPVKGGVHPRFGTRNMILPLTDHQYVEVVTVLEHPAAEKAPFGRDCVSRAPSSTARRSDRPLVPMMERTARVAGRRISRIKSIPPEPPEGWFHHPAGGTDRGE